MTYDLDQFCSDLARILAARGNAGLPEIADKLALLLQNPAFVQATFTEDMAPGKRELFHDPVSDAYVLAHVWPAAKNGNPHSHGASWAIYGNAIGFTEMTEWRRLNPESEEHAVLTVADRYRLEPGHARAYGPHVIHSTAHPEKAFGIRVTGTDLDVLPRYRFSPKKDAIVEAVR